jgi:hypothetical protein
MKANVRRKVNRRGVRVQRKLWRRIRETAEAEGISAILKPVIAAVVGFCNGLIIAAAKVLLVAVMIRLSGVEFWLSRGSALAPDHPAAGSGVAVCVAISPPSADIAKHSLNHWAACSPGWTS